MPTSQPFQISARKQPGWEAWRDLLAKAATEGELIISPVAFAEYTVAYSSVASVQTDLAQLQVIFEPIKPEAAYLAGQIFLSYRQKGGPRQHLIPDFLIAAHASTQANRLAAIDRGYLRPYFPALPLLRPSA